MKRWVMKDFKIVWHWHRGRLQGEENRGWYHILWNGKDIQNGFRTKHEAERWLGSFLKKANAIRKAAFEAGKYDGQ